MAIISALSMCSYADDKTWDEVPSWDDIIEQYIDDHGLRGKNFALGYMNLVTGEEHYYNGDQYMTAASVYKIPLNMYFSHKVYTGEESFDTRIGGVRYEDIQRSSIVSSNNQLSESLQMYVGGDLLENYRAAIAPLMGVDIYDYNQIAFLQHNWFTPRQVIFCLNELYANQDEYPRCLDYMTEAKPGEYFKRNQEEGLQIAHKFGYLPTDNGTVVNDAGIVFTEEPFAIVLLTQGWDSGSNMEDYCKLMTKYNRTATALGFESPETDMVQEAETEPFSVEVLETELYYPEPENTPEPEAIPAEQIVVRGELRPLIPAAIGGVLAVCAAAVIISSRKRAGRVAGTVMIVCAAVSCALCFVPWQNDLSITDITEELPAEIEKIPAEPQGLERTTGLRLGSSASEDDVKALSSMEGIKYVDATLCPLEESLYEIKQLLPDCEVIYSISLWGNTFSSDAEILDLSNSEYASLQEFRDKISRFENVREINLLGCGLDSAQQEELVNEYGDIDFLWEVHFGAWTVRSDITCFSNKGVGKYKAEEYAPLLKYCTKLRALKLTAVSFTNASAFENLKDLQYLSLGQGSNFSDITPLEQLPSLRFIKCNQSYGNAVLSKLDDWGSAQENAVMTKVFNNWRYVEEFNSWDDMKWADGFKF